METMTYEKAIMMEPAAMESTSMESLAAEPTSTKSASIEPSTAKHVAVEASAIKPSMKSAFSTRSARRSGAGKKHCRCDYNYVSQSFISFCFHKTLLFIATMIIRF